MVSGPGMFVVMGVSSGGRGGRLLWRWWLWMRKEDLSLFVTCVTFASTFERARAIALESCSRPNL